MSEIMIVILVNGQQLLAEVEDADGGFLLSHPMSIVMAPPDPQQPERGPRVGLNPYLQYTKDFDLGLFIQHKHIVAQAVPVDELVAMHKQMFSRIITPPGILPPR